MRKLIATIVAFYFIFSATGINVHMHYCMDELDSWGLVNDSSATCSVCGMKKSETGSGCCKDESVFLKNTSDQQSTGMSVELPQIFNSVTTAPSENIVVVYISTFTNKNFGYLFKVRSNIPPVYLFNCVFLI
jgi:hypothetical protein